MKKDILELIMAARFVMLVEDLNIDGIEFEVVEVIEMPETKVIAASTGIDPRYKSNIIYLVMNDGTVEVINAPGINAEFLNTTTLLASLIGTSLEEASQIVNNTVLESWVEEIANVMEKSEMNLFRFLSGLLRRKEQNE